MLVAYEIYRGPKNQFGKIPGVLGRSEFGLEIVVAIAYQVYIVGLVVRQSLPAAELLPESAAAEVAGRRLAESVVAALGKRVRRALHAAGQLGRRACRRNELEPEQRLGVSVGEGPGPPVRGEMSCFSQLFPVKQLATASVLGGFSIAAIGLLTI